MFTGVFLTLYLVLSETNRLIWVEDSLTYKIKYYELNSILPSSILNIPAPTSYSMYKVITDDVTSSLQFADDDSKEVWFIIGVPSIDQAAFLVAPLAQELNKYAQYISSSSPDH